MLAQGDSLTFFSPFITTQKKIIIIISNTDFEKLGLMYQTDEASKGITINTFCQQNGVPYPEFEKWYTPRVVEKHEVTGIPDEEEEQTTRTVVSLQPKQKHPGQSKGGMVYL